MIAWAEAEFRRTKPSSDGATEADHAEAANLILARLGDTAKAAATVPEAEPECPHVVAYLWERFLQILDGVKADGMGPSRIGWSDLVDWQLATGEDMDAWEARLIVRLSSLRAGILSERTARP